MSALRKILVVDDDPVVGKSFVRVLSKDKGYLVVTAQNAAEALQQLKEQRYDMMFTDIKMPGMSGVELAEHVRATQPWVPVVIITGFDSLANEARAQAAGVSSVMHKPLSPQMIEDGVLSALRAPALALVPPVAAPQVPVLAPSAAQQGALKAAALTLAAPFIGLAYALALPFIGTAMLLWFAVKAFMATSTAKRIPGAVLHK